MGVDVKERCMPSNHISAPPRTRHGTIGSVNLNAIRGAAALVVLIGHTRSLFFSSFTAHVPAPSQHLQQGIGSGSVQISMGNEAVIVFFVLSGYLVGGSAIRDLNNGTWSWKKYLLLRLTRLWIVLMPALLFGILVDHTGLRVFHGNFSIYTGPPGLCVAPCNVADRLLPKVVAGNMFFLQTIFVATAGTNNALWSLANEFWYYLAFPMCLLTVRTDQSIVRRVCWATLLLAIGVLVGKGIFLLFFVWLLGALISVLPLEAPRQAARIGSCVLATIFLVLTITVRRIHLSYYGAEWVIAVCFSMWLYLLLHRTEVAQPTIYKGIADFLSRISYTLYLVHLPLAIFLCACINTPWRHWDKTPSHLAAFILLNLVLVLFSYAFYLAFEANTDRIRRALFHRHMSEPIYTGWNKCGRLTGHHR